MNGNVVITVDLDKIDTSGLKILDDEMDTLGLKKQGTSSEGHELIYPAGTYVSSADFSDSDGQLKHYYHSLVEVMKKHQLRGRYMVWIAPDAHLVCGDVQNA